MISNTSWHRRDSHSIGLRQMTPDPIRTRRRICAHVVARASVRMLFQLGEGEIPSAPAGESGLRQDHFG